jgi:hypothetical protein
MNLFAETLARGGAAVQLPGGLQLPLVDGRRTGRDGDAVHHCQRPPTALVRSGNREAN